MTETWKPIVGAEGIYEVSNLGRIKSLPRVVFRGDVKCVRKGKINKLVKHRDGYLQIKLKFPNNPKRTSHLVHRLVAEAFIEGQFKDATVNHKNFNKQDNRVENLEWISSIDNLHHAIVGGRHFLRFSSGDKNVNAKLTSDKVSKIKSLIGLKPIKDISEEFGVSPSTIYHIKNGRIWK